MRTALIAALSLLTLSACQTAGEGTSAQAEPEAAEPTPQVAVARQAGLPDTVSIEEENGHIYVQLEQFVPNRMPEGSCLSEREIRADQFFRLRVSMMNVGLTCRPIFEGDPFNQYMQFIADTAGSVRSVQGTLESFFGRYGGGRPARLVDTYQTNLANDEQHIIRALGPQAFCDARQQQFEAVTGYSDAEVSEWIDGAFTRRSAAYNAC